MVQICGAFWNFKVLPINNNLEHWPLQYGMPPLQGGLSVATHGTLYAHNQDKQKFTTVFPRKGMALI